MTQPVEPNVENLGRGFIPFRGTEGHGVPFGNYAGETENEVATVDIDYDPPEKEPEPLPVKIISDPSPTTVTRFSGSLTNVDARPRLVVSPVGNRTGGSITNQGPGTLFLGPDNSVSRLAGYPVKPNESFDIPGSEAVWAVAEGRAATPSPLVLPIVAHPLGAETATVTFDVTLPPEFAMDNAARRITAYSRVTAMTGTGPTFNTVISETPDHPNYFPIATGTALTAIGDQRLTADGFTSRRLRVTYVIGGGTPSVTFVSHLLIVPEIPGRPEIPAEATLLVKQEYTVTL